MTPTQVAQLTEAALETIAKLAHVGEDRAAAALAAIRGIITALKDGDSGKLDAQAVLTKIETFRDELAGNEAAAIAAFKARTGK